MTYKFAQKLQLRESLKDGDSFDKTAYITWKDQPTWFLVDWNDSSFTILNKLTGNAQIRFISGKPERVFDFIN